MHYHMQVGSGASLQSLPAVTISTIISISTCVHFTVCLFALERCSFRGS